MSETLLQFDGSAHAHLQVGGAGYAIYAVRPAALELIHHGAIGLSPCSDNIEAEAVALECGLTDLAEILDGTPDYDRQNLIVQGDILPLLRHVAGHGRFRRTDLSPTIESIRCYNVPHAKMVYLPREANKVADFLAIRGAGK